MNTQPKVRSYVALAVHQRVSARDMGNRYGKGRSRKDQATRSQVKHTLNKEARDA